MGASPKQRFRRLLLVAALAAVSACGARTGLAPGTGAGADGGQTPSAIDGAIVEPALDAGADVIVSVDANLDPVCVSPEAGVSGAICTRSVVVGTITRSRSSCFVDLAAKEGERGVLRYSCAGGGAEFVFGTHTFTGSFDGVRFDTCEGTTFDFIDGCKWDSSQRIQGDFATGFRFDYVEAPSPGETGCERPCSATGTVTVF